MIGAYAVLYYAAAFNFVVRAGSVGVCHTEEAVTHPTALLSDRNTQGTGQVVAGGIVRGSTVMEATEAVSTVQSGTGGGGMLHTFGRGADKDMPRAYGVSVKVTYRFPTQVRANSFRASG